MSLAPTLDDDGDQNRVPEPNKPSASLRNTGDRDVADLQVKVNQSHPATTTTTPSQSPAPDSNDPALKETQQPVSADAGHTFGLSNATDNASNKSASVLPIAGEQTGAISNTQNNGNTSRKSPPSPDRVNLEQVEFSDSSDEEDADGVENLSDDDWYTSDEDSPTATPQFRSMLKRQNRRIKASLKTYYCYPFTKETLYKDVAEDERIDDFLKSSPLYDQQQKCWVGLRKQRGNPKLSRSEVIDSVAAIISSVIEELGGVGGRRHVMKTDGVKLYHEDEEGAQNKQDREQEEHERDSVEGDYSSPSLVIVAEGPSFERPEGDPRGIGFANVTTCVDVVSGNGDNVSAELLGRHAIYARQIFIQQPNRRFVRTFVLSNDGILFFHFDRSGLHAKFIGGYHSDSVKTFVRLIIGLSLLNEEALGLDSSVQWKVDAQGRKKSGTLKITDDDTKVTQVYKLASVRPSHQLHVQMAARLIAWVVWDHGKKKERLVVRDDWREIEDNTGGGVAAQTSEYEILKKMRNLDGVSQMFSYEAMQGGWQTKDSGVNCSAPPGQPCNRSRYPSNWICSRSVMETYGPVISHFKSEMQLLCAVRDAIEGHRNLYLKAQSVHCDVGSMHIAFGKPDAPPGRRGILVNLVPAKPISTLSGDTVALGDPFFLSVGLLVNAYSLQHSSSETVLPHDYLDDLQSFFYTIASIMYQYDSSGQEQDPMPRFLQEWESSLYSLRKHRVFKQQLLLAKIPVDPLKHLGRSWSKASRKLLKVFHEYSCEMGNKKEKIRYEADHVGWQTKNFEAVDYVPQENRKSYYARRWGENRIRSRIVTELYGKDIHRYESERELLCHRNFYSKAGLLHRDIAWANIVFGNPRAPPGQEGILIDLDIAKLVSEFKPEADVIQGHCLFFSIGILINGISGETGDKFLTHDYLDDLQSLFYVLASIMYFYDGPSQKQRPFGRFMQEWLKHQHCGSYSLMEEHLELKKNFILSEQPTDPCKLGVGRYTDAC
ncbi:hypothetical protein EST38_g9330 [Candolleomyces aberdarensis]|uniref:Fungal-type protein kinase domain-containing protein n=1 Tax=Candolleomyces aberdarensis TaxID=2316362 RepID=A0A4Q2DA74_9AGAR|nr:hypothetical protein EST38_g9330 [Candolleomyces aberdarensis]